MPKYVKQSRMEVLLDAEIASSRDQLAADCKRAELGAYWARLGRFEDASALLAELRGRNELKPQVELSAWVHLADGLLAYFRNGGASKADGVLRAYALCAAAGLQDLRAICAAWLAQWDYTRVDIVSLVRHVREALELADRRNHAGRSRANLVGAQALHLAGRLDLAQVWYRRSRDHALASSDDATIGALMHNMAWQRMLLLRQAILTGGASSTAGRHALVSAESTAHYEQLVGDLGWQELKPLLRAQIISLQGDAGAALGLYEEHLSDANLADRWQAYLLADKAWCHIELGQRTLAETCAGDALTCLTDETQVDDRAATHSRLSQAFAKLGYQDRMNEHNILAGDEWAKFGAIQAKIAELLSSVDENGQAC